MLYSALRSLFNVDTFLCSFFRRKAGLRLPLTHCNLVNEGHTYYHCFEKTNIPVSELRAIVKPLGFLLHDC